MTATDQRDEIRHEIVVSANQESAFEGFTKHIEDWWPRENTFARIAGDQDALQTILIEPAVTGRWFERSTDGNETAWGEVRSWEPPDRLSLGWQITPEGLPEPDPSKASNVEVTFLPEGTDRTRVVVRHSDFNRHGPDGAAIWRSAMNSPEGWPKFLDRFQRFVEESGSTYGHTVRS